MPGDQDDFCLLSLEFRLGACRPPSKENPFNGVLVDTGILTDCQRIATVNPVLRMKMNNGRSRHTASYLLSHFLCSKDSLAIPSITASLVAVLRYMYDVMEMNYSRTGLTVCDLSISHIATYARASRASTTRLIAKAIKLELLSVTLKRPRAPTHYGIGNLISTRLTVSLDMVDNPETRLSYRSPSTRLTTSLRNPKQGSQ